MVKLRFEIYSASLNAIFDHEIYFTDKGISLFELKFEYESILFVLPRWSKLQLKQCIHGIQIIHHKVNNNN